MHKSPASGNAKCRGNHLKYFRSVRFRRSGGQCPAARLAAAQEVRRRLAFATMASADFLPFVVAAHILNTSTPMRWQDLPRVLTRSFPLYLPHLPEAICVAIGLRLVWQTYPCLRPYMQFLFVEPVVFPSEDLFSLKVGFLQIPSHDGHSCLWLAHPTAG